MIILYPIDNYKRGFVIDGHADFGEHGKDIVCSAVSSLSLSVLLTINKFHKTTYIKKSGFLAVSYEYHRDIEYFMEVLLTGMKQLSYQYPDHITISLEEYSDEN